MSEGNKLSFLLARYLDNSCTAAQFNELFALIEKDEKKEELLLLLKEHWISESQVAQHPEGDWERMHQKMMAQPDAGYGDKNQKNLLYRRIAIAASVLIALSVGLLFFMNKQEQQQIVQQSMSVKSEQLAPGGNKATLTLADGKKITLDDKANGTILSQAGIQITKKADGKLVYKLDEVKGKANQLNLFNTIETPRGGQYEITMPDGTKVWLNAMSSLKYPLVFDKNERKVLLKGEAYFEVAKQKDAPFKVVTDLQEIRVLGTHFNVNAYDNENSTRTTLLEGAVKVWVKGSLTTLKPGQQAVLKADHVDVLEVDTEIAVAWKNGTFNFNRESLESIMRQVSRWYDVDIIYQDEASRKLVLSGSVSRFENARELLQVLSLTKLVQFRIEGRRIIVMQ